MVTGAKILSEIGFDRTCIWRSILGLCKQQRIDFICNTVILKDTSLRLSG